MTPRPFPSTFITLNPSSFPERSFLVVSSYCTFCSSTALCTTHLLFLIGALGSDVLDFSKERQNLTPQSECIKRLLFRDVCDMVRVLQQKLDIVQGMQPTVHSFLRVHRDVFHIEVEASECNGPTVSNCQSLLRYQNGTSEPTATMQSSNWTGSHRSLQKGSRLRTSVQQPEAG